MSRPDQFHTTVYKCKNNSNFSYHQHAHTNWSSWSSSRLTQSEEKMDLKLLTIAIFLLVSVNVESRSVIRSLSSVYRRNNCSGGNLLKIHTDNCTAFTAKRRCKAKCDGHHTYDVKTRFTIEAIRGRKCIQFTDIQNDTQYTYALKVINRTNVVFEEQGCQNAIDNNFLFEETKIRINKRFVYNKHNSTTCLASDCSGNISLISTTNINNDMCLFSKLR